MTYASTTTLAAIRAAAWDAARDAAWAAAWDAQEKQLRLMLDAV
jgi:hypothetical protein